MTISKRRLLWLIFVCALSVHPTAEAVRRFFYYSDVIYAVADAAFLIFAVTAYWIAKPRISIAPLLLLSIYVIWGMLCLLINSGSPMLIVVGLRPLLLAAGAYIVAASFFSLADTPFRTLIHVVAFWTAIVLLVGWLQIYLGVGAIVNKLPVAAGVEGGGRGDYVASGQMLAGLFRPTSIFMSTGRLGQFAFMNTLLLMTTLLLATRRRISSLWPTAIGIALVMLSGQRAAFLFLLISFLILLIRSGNLKMLLKIALIFILFMPFIMLLNDSIVKLVLLRFASVFGSIGNRLTENMSGALISVKQFLLFGKGIGFFTFGSLPFGGHIYYEYMARYGGGGENSWLRIQGETGLPGMLVFAVLMWWIATRSFARFRVSRFEEGRALHFVAGYSVIALAAWSFTADVYGNYLMLMQLFLFFGASSGYWAREARSASSLGEKSVSAR